MRNINCTIAVSVVIVLFAALSGLPCHAGEAPKPSPVAKAQQAGDVGDAEFVEWARENAVGFDSLDWRDCDPAKFSFLDEALKNKRVIYLGETDHFVAQRMEFRLLLIQALARRGFRRIGMEMGLSDAKRMDRFLATGDETWLKRVALYGYRGDMRTDRKDGIAGWTDDAHPALTKTMSDEAQWFLRELRKFNEELAEGEPRLKWFGYDLSFRPGGGYADAGELLAPHEASALAREILQRMARVPGESRLDEAARLEAVVAALDARKVDLVELMGAADARKLRRALQRMADAFRFIDGLQAAKDSDSVIPALRERERRMYHNIDEDLANWPADEKIILLGHALHLSKHSETIQTRNFGPMWKSIGTYLNEKLPGQVYGIWLLHDHGWHGQARGMLSVVPFRSPANSIERLLAQVDPIFVLPLGSTDPREKWLETQRTFSCGGGPTQTALSQQADCLFFVETTTAPGTR